MSLATDLQEAEQSRRVKRDPAMTAKMDAATADLAASGIVDNSLKVGDKAPDFALPNVKGNTVKLSEVLAGAPVVLSFYRGGWCPYCNIALQHLQQHLGAFEAQGAKLVTVSPQTPDASLSTAEKNALEFEVLSDAGNRVARDYGLVFTLSENLHGMYGNPDGINLAATNGDGSFELPVAATYVIQQDGTVAYAFADADYTRRAEPSEIVDVLKGLKG